MESILDGENDFTVTRERELEKRERERERRGNRDHLDMSRSESGDLQTSVPPIFLRRSKGEEKGNDCHCQFAETSCQETANQMFGS